MAISHRYCDFATGNDYIGASFTDGAFTVADMTLTKTGAFTLNKANHWLYLTDNGSGRVTAGYYKIASVTSANAVVLATSPKSGATDPTDVVCTAATGGTAAPFRSVQGALDLIARDATNGDQVNIKAGTAQTNAAAILLTTYGAPDYNKWLVFRGYTSTANDGGIAEIDCNGVAFFSATNNAYWVLQDLYLHNFGNTTGIQGGNSDVIHCEVSPGASSPSTKYPINTSGRVIDCYVHAYGTNSLGLQALQVVGCYVENAGGYYGIAPTAGGCAINNVVVLSGNGNGIYLASQGIAYGNTVYSSVGNTAIAIVGAGNTWNHAIINNVIQGFSGAGGKGIDGSSSNYNIVTGYNAFYNCATTEAYAKPYIDLGHQTTLGASPFVNAAGGDFDINGSVTGVTEAGFPTVFNGLSSTTPKIDLGASQAGAGAGVSGGKPSYGDRSGGKF